MYICSVQEATVWVKAKVNSQILVPEQWIKARKISSTEIEVYIISVTWQLETE